ncbi:MAG: hypothetical protein ABIV51_07480 [Saprospiraceae bacterium]
MQRIIYLFILLWTVQKTGAQQIEQRVSSTHETKNLTLLPYDLMSVGDPIIPNFELIQEPSGKKFKVLPPSGKVALSSGVQIDLGAAIPDVLVSLERFYNIRTSITCDADQIVEIYGYDDSGQRIEPEILLSPDAGKGFKLEQGNLRITRNTNDDALVYFKKPVHKILIFNNKSVVCDAFKPYLLAGAVSKLSSPSGAKETIELNPCIAGSLNFALDASGSMHTVQRKQALSFLDSLLETAMEVTGPLLLNVSLFNATAESLVKDRVLLDKKDCQNILKLLETAYLAHSCGEKCWTNIAAALDMPRATPYDPLIVITDGLSNGNSEGRQLMIDALPAMLSTGENYFLYVDQVGEQTESLRSGTPIDTLLENIRAVPCERSQSPGQYRAYPNPFADEIFISSTKGVSPEDLPNIGLYNSTGIQIACDIQLADGRFHIMTPTLPPGLYFILIHHQAIKIIKG